MAGVASVSSGAQPMFLGVDASTQALKASLLDSNLNVENEIEVRFDGDLPHYGTRGGTLLGPEGSGIVYSPVMLVVEAMDMLFDRIGAAKWPVERIMAISAAGQQHASVYWSHEAERRLGSMDASKKMASQLAGAFSRSEIPNWQDSSTLHECAAIEEGIGGAQHLAHLTGSKAHSRFTGPQIMRFRQEQPEAYENTARISLVSSFITTLLCLDGNIKGIDESDACGMNLWDMSTPQRGWVPQLLDIVSGGHAQSLEKKLGRVESDGGRTIGHIGSWFVQRYGFAKDCIVCPGTGDNPATFLSFTLRENEGLLSLGTSDTLLVSTSTFNPDPEFHAFFHPAQIVGTSKADGKHESRTNEANAAMRYFNMLVYKNGSLAREHVRDKHFDKSWDKFNAAVEAARPKSADDLPKASGFWWLKPDIIPSNATGVFKFVSSRNAQSEHADASKAELIAEFPQEATNGIAMLESQMLSYRSRSAAILRGKSSSGSNAGKARLARVYATGGAAANPTICSVIADVMGCHVCKPVVYDHAQQQWHNANSNACSVAAAYKAAWAYARHAGACRDIAFDDFVNDAASRRRASRQSQHDDKASDGQIQRMEILEEGVAVVARPRYDRASAYSASVAWWATLEERALAESRRHTSTA